MACCLNDDCTKPTVINHYQIDASFQLKSKITPTIILELYTILYYSVHKIIIIKVNAAFLYFYQVDIDMYRFFSTTTDHGRH